jgi:exopolysaccharide biosynthesis polyprenyl glycosylphosphotransferase
MKRAGLIVFGDFIAFFTSFLIILFVRFGARSYESAIDIHLLPFTILYLSWVLIFYLFGLYDVLNIRPTLPHLKRFGSALSTSFVIGIFLFYFVPAFGITPKTNLVLQVFGFGLISLLIRRAFYIVFSKKMTRPTILIGENKFFNELEQTINKNPQIGLLIISHESSLLEVIQKYPNLKNLILILGKSGSGIPENQISNFYKNKAEIMDVAEAYERYLQKIPVDYIDQSWMIGNVNSKENIFYNIASKIINILASAVILIIFSPFLLVAAIFIYLYDHGPIFYVQERTGINGEIFKLYKLRSMIVGTGKDEKIWCEKEDKRITPVGRIIRRLHIDEIPQMINILKGDLSFVGPRPERTEFLPLFENNIPHYSFRHIVRPGFTGWAQIKYRYAYNVEESKEKFEYDLYYIKNRNLFLDFGIILRTIQIIFTH